MRQLAYLALIVAAVALSPRLAWSQTPSPLQEWQYSGGPVINIQYRDQTFITTGDGMGVNIFHGSHYQVGFAMTYDLGRKEKDDLQNLHGMGDISAAPVAKVFGSWVISRYFPMILRVDARQFIGGAEGLVGDAGGYIPLPGSSKSFVMFAGPSITMAPAGPDCGWQSAPQEL